MDGAPTRTRAERTQQPSRGGPLLLYGRFVRTLAFSPPCSCRNDVRPAARRALLSYRPTCLPPCWCKNTASCGRHQSNIGRSCLRPSPHSCCPARARRLDNSRSKRLRAWWRRSIAARCWMRGSGKRHRCRSRYPLRCRYLPRWAWKPGTWARPWRYHQRPPRSSPPRRRCRRRLRPIPVRHRKHFPRRCRLPCPPSRRFHSPPRRTHQYHSSLRSHRCPSTPHRCRCSARR